MGDSLNGQPNSDKLRTAGLTLSALLDADVIIFEYPGYGITQEYDGTLLKSRCCCGCSSLCTQHRPGAFKSEEVFISRKLISACVTLLALTGLFHTTSVLYHSNQ